MEEVILIFDVGKTNKKVLLFDRNLNVVFEEESRFDEVIDDEGFPCDDGDLLESWIRSTLHSYLNHERYQVRAINFTTYGATLVYLDAAGRRLTPIYNYLKPISEKLLDGFYKSQGGVEEFSRRTASPSLGMLNSGLQIIWLKRTRPELFLKVKRVLHLPQYFAFLVHGKISSEHTSIGCHTGLWDFDKMQYHPWLKEEGIMLPEPHPVSETFPVEVEGKQILVGIGIHDSSSSLAPFIMTVREPFVLVSTGTWSIHMNPFNHEPLTYEELREDCLCFMGVHGKPVKSSRFFLGRIHDLNVERLRLHFKKERFDYKGVHPGFTMIKECWESGEMGQRFFRAGIPEGMVDLQVDPDQFDSFEEAYTRLLVDLSGKVVHSVGLICSEEESTKRLYVTGGFAKNPIFISILTLAFPDKEIFTPEVDNASALGAALVVSDKIWKGFISHLDLGLTTPAPHRPQR